MRAPASQNRLAHPRGDLSLFSTGVNPSKVVLIDAYGQGDSLLDVGCGNGLYAMRTSRNYSRIVLLDVVDRRDQASAHLPFVTLDASEISKLPSGPFSTILAFDIIEHLDDDTAFLRAARDICEGVIIGSVPAAEDDRLRAIGLTNIHHIDKTHRREYRREELIGALTSSGFRDARVFPQPSNGLLLAPFALSTPNVFSRACAYAIYRVMMGLLKVGVLRNTSVADWLFVARR